MQIVLSELLKNILQKLNIIDDFVVEHGSSGVWSWRKWNSGVAECWMRWQGTESTYTTNMLTGAPYGYYKTWALPFTFKEDYIKTATVQVGTAVSIVATGGLGDTLSEVALHWASSGTGLSTVNMRIIGKWK